MRIAIINHKGGVGKITLAVNVAFRYKGCRRKLLLVDFDEQRNATSLYAGYSWDGEVKLEPDRYVTLSLGLYDK
jgi:cellulose biosynthesis protein BcsQ